MRGYQHFTSASLSSATLLFLMLYLSSAIFSNESIYFDLVRNRGRGGERGKGGGEKEGALSQIEHNNTSPRFQGGEKQ
jgi:hypothetical protein